MRIIMPIVMAVVLFFSAGCQQGFLSMYRPNIQQGNVLSHDNVLLVKEGMTQEQVSYILGFPLIHDPFHAARWDYVYTLFDAVRNITEERRLVVYFNDKKIVEKVEHFPRRVVQGRLVY